jgi:hypothetical protein
MQTWCIGPMVMISVVHLYHDGTFPRLFWDLSIALFDHSNTCKEESIHFDFLDFTFGLRSGFSEEWSYEALIDFMQLMISCIFRSRKVDSCIITLQTNAMSRGCFTPYRLVWDLGEFTIYKVLVFAGRDFANKMLGDCLDDAWMIEVG